MAKSIKRRLLGTAALLATACGLTTGAIRWRRDPVQSKSRAHRSRPVRFSPPMPRGARHLPGDTLPCLAQMARSDNGSVAIEFAFVASILVVLIMNVLDFSRLIWAHMEVDYAAQMGAQAAYKTCSTGTPPATTNCSDLSNKVTTAIQSTSLGTAVTLASGSPSETYYCVSGATLQSVGAYSAPPIPFNCSAAGSSSTAPGDYIGVSVTYTYTPTFAGLTLAMAQTFTGSSVGRLN